VLLRLPLTLAIISGLVVRSGEERFVIPQAGLEELVSIKPGADPDRVELAHDQEVVRLRNRLLPVVRLGELLARPRPFDGRAKAAIAAAHAAERSAADAPARPMAVVRTSGERYGLIIDEILGTEEIVVKPLHGALRRLRCFSGCTILGDGGVAFILDVDGAGEHAGIRYTQSEAADTDVAGARALQTVDGEEIHDVILFRYGPAEQFGVPLTMVRRIEAIRTDEIQRVGDREFIVRDGVSIYVLGLDKVLQVSAPRARPPTMFLLLPKFLRRPVGFLVTEIVDTVETRILFREDSYREDGLLGSMSLQGHLTLFPDIFRATEKAEPEWLGQWRQHAPPPSHRRVLLVEDAAFFRHMVRRYLEDGGFEVETAVNGRDGLMQLSNRDFDIVISDLMMPEMDGWSFAEEVRRRARKRQMPMLALSGLQDERDQSRALQCGFDRYVAKFDREAFLGTVVELLQDAGGAGPAPPPESPGGAP
jgi:two-component system chemotaxis sensor kinase CheA